MSSALLIAAAVAEAPEAAEPTAFWLNPGGWVALAVIIVLALLVWKRCRARSARRSTARSR